MLSSSVWQSGPKMPKTTETFGGLYIVAVKAQGKGDPWVLWDPSVCAFFWTPERESRHELLAA